MLKGHIVADAAYNSKARQTEYASMCQPGTRKRVLQKLTHWAEGDNDQPLCWLYGPAGSGKSTIAHTIAERCGGKLAGNFFFSRGKHGRSDSTGLFPTLAYQLAAHLPPLQVPMECALRTDPLILSQSLGDQFRKLILGPILSIEEPLPSMVIVLDALDECGDGDLLMEVVKLLGDAFTTHRLPFRFLLTSRPEEHIRNTFALPEMQSKTYPVALYDFNARDDIRAYLESQFIDVLQKQEVFLRGVPRPWPSPVVLKELVDKSEGLFIYVSTLVKYVGEGPGLPNEKLEAVRKIHPGIDPLYKQVLSTVLQDTNSRGVIGTLMLLRRPLKITAMAELLQLTSAKIRDTLRGCHSVLIVPDADDEEIKPYHASLRDFLIDHDRSKDYFVDPLHHQTITLNCLHVMASGLAHNATGNEPLLYACQNWCYHFCAVVSSGRAGVLGESESSFGQEMKSFLKKLVHEWLKAWMYNVQNERNMEGVHEAMKSSCIQLKVFVFSNFFISFFEILKLFREFLA
jgi:hypothetical protein